MQNVNAILPGNTIKVQTSENSQSRQSNAVRFGQYMSDASSGEEQNNTVVSKNTDKADQSSNGKCQTYMAGKEQTQQTQDASEAAGNTVSNNPSNADVKDSQIDVRQLQEEIKDVIEDVTGIDDDVFAQTLAQMGINPLQLLNPETLQQFIVTLNGGSDALDMLTSEDMMSQFTDILDLLQDSAWMNQPDVENSDLKSILSDPDLLQAFIDRMNGTNDETGSEFDVRSDMTSEIQEQQTDTLADSSADITADRGQMAGDSVDILPDQQERESTILAEMTMAVNDNSSGQEQPGWQDPSFSDGITEQIDMTVKDGFLQDSSGNSSFLENQPESMVYTPEGETSIPLDGSSNVFQFVENMVQSANNVENIPEPVDMQRMLEVVTSVVERIQSSMQEDGTTTLEMQLNPERLGKMLFTVSSKEGVMTASFVVQTTEAKAALESQMITLRENLEQRNLKVEAVEVSVSDFAFSQSGQADTGDQKDFQHGNGKQSRFRYDAEEDTDEAEQLSEKPDRSMRLDSGSSIDFTA